ncbi:MAG: LLM class flavin-dependent oxidoreductase [Chloroflexota bacterium]|nr:LLM class flavin-dependent oxidoreductase [Chloroflexota bacterium]
MRIGVGLPAAIPGCDATQLGEWAAIAESLGFSSLGVIDHLVYDNVEPIVALAAAAGRTRRVELLTTVLNVPYRRNALVLAKQLASLDRLCGQRLTAGLGLGGWPEDHDAVGPTALALGKQMDEMLLTMRRAWAGEFAGASGPMPATPPGRPQLLFGGFSPAAYRRAAVMGQGWVAPSFGLEPLVSGITAVRSAWAAGGRQGQARIVVERYFSLGPEAEAVANRYLHHYYGDAYLQAIRADTPTTAAHLRSELERLRKVGCDDVVPLPCSADLHQLEFLTEVLDATGFGVSQMAAA